MSFDEPKESHCVCCHEWERREFELMAERDALKKELEQVNRVYGSREGQLKEMRENNDALQDKINDVEFIAAWDAVCLMSEVAKYQNENKALQGQCAALRDAGHEVDRLTREDDDQEVVATAISAYALGLLRKALASTSQAASDYRAAVEKPLRELLVEWHKRDCECKDWRMSALCMTTYKAIAALEYRRIK